MKFACPKCNTRYSISDDKVPPAKTLRFPCKKCGNVIRLRRKEGAPAAPKPTPLEAGSTRVAPAAELDQLRQQAASPTGDHALATKVASVAELNQALRAGQSAEPDPFDLGAGGSTKVASVAEIQRALRSGAEPEPTPALAPAADEEWFALVGGKQEGPLSQAKLLELLRTRMIDKRTYVWRDGMGDWQRLGAVAELRDHAEQTGDAAWRVMAPVDDRAGDFSESTVAMNAKQINEQLRRSREIAEAPPGDPANNRATDVGTPVDLSDPELVAALTGNPTGDRMTRPLSQGAASDLLASPELYPADLGGDLGIESLRQPEPEPELLARHPPPDLVATPAHSHLGTSFPEALEEPVSDPLGDLGSLDAEEPGELFAEPLESDRGEYLNAPPGESTRVFMATAGIYKRRRFHQAATVIGILVSVLIVAVVSLDILGLVQIPLMGMVYEKTGLVDPNRERGIQRAREALATPDLDPQRRTELEAWLGKMQPGGTAPQPGKTRPGPGKAAVPPVGPTREGVKDTQTMKDGERKLAEAVFGDARKTDRRIVLADPDRLQAPNLPDGLTQDAIVQVFSDNSSSMTLCYNESTRKGERLSGKMEIEVSIAADGTVTEVKIGNPELAKTVMGTCTLRRVKTWRFPRFNGEPVTVVIPYVLQSVL